MWYRSFRHPLIAAAVAASAVVLTSAGATADDSWPNDGSSTQAVSDSFGGAAPVATTRTVQHWSGQTTNPADGVTYQYNIVGADPATEGSATVGVDIIPIDVTSPAGTFAVSDQTLNGVLASPLFQNNDYTGTPAIGLGPGQGRGGPLSAGNTNAQLLDAQMRSQFDKVGSDYHLLLDTPTVFDRVTVRVPAGKAEVIGGTLAVNQKWFQTRVQNLMGKLHLDSTRLAIFVTQNVGVYDGNPAHCCVLGAHGAGHVTGGLNGPVNGNGNQAIQTFVWGSWFTPGAFTFSGMPFWEIRDIFALSHEVSEWANDPFNTNTVQSWMAPNAAQYGCSGMLEVSDPLFGVAFAVGSTNPDNALGAYHVSDEAFLPWFMRTSPSDAQASQFSGGTRYTFLGDLNPLPWFHQPAPTC